MLDSVPSMAFGPIGNFSRSAVKLTHYRNWEVFELQPSRREYSSNQAPRKSTFRIRSLLKFVPELVQNFRPPLAPKFTLQFFESHGDHVIVVRARETWI